MAKAVLRQTRRTDLEDAEAPVTVLDALLRAERLFGDSASYSEGGRAAGRSLTWAELSQRVQKVASGLVGLGLNRGDRVAICAENSIDWITAFYASAAAGASAVLVYYDLKANEINEQVTRPDSRFLFTSKAVIGRLGESLPAVERTLLLGADSESAREALSLEALAGTATAASRDRLESQAPEPGDLAAIVYTSGTTAGPKGVMLSHRNLIAGAEAAVRGLDLGHDASALLVLPLHHSFAFTVAAILPALIGGHIVLENDLRRIRDRLQEYRPTIFFGVPALYELMYRNIVQRAESAGRLRRMQAWQERVRLVKRLTGVNIGPIVFRSVHEALGGNIRFLVSGAAALKPETALDYYSLGLPLLQGAGVTETADGFAVQRFSRRRFLFTRYYERHVGCVGQALPGVEARLLDVPEKGISVAAGGEGELALKGESVFLGYWQAPEATEAALVDGWVRTGDLARIDEDGNIYLTGRSKYVIVLDSGEKVHPDEVETKLEESDLVEDVCVTGRRVREKTIVTAVIYPNVDAVLARIGADGGGSNATTVERLIAGEVQRLSEQLVAYKRVGRIELSDTALPKTAVRKVARGHLADSHSFDYQTWASSGASP
jgi:long-chain acyl-CoA synthetase